MNLNAYKYLLLIISHKLSESNSLPNISVYQNVQLSMLKRNVSVDFFIKFCYNEIIVKLW